MRHFRRGSSTYLCAVCGRRTRETGVQSMGNDTCPQCYELAGIENEISDGHCSLEDRRATIAGLLVEIAAKGGSLTEWQTTFPDMGGGRP